MKLEHRFTVPAPVPRVWAALLDPERVAACLPGATLTGVDGPKFTGTVQVKLGPVSLLYQGSGQFTSVSEEAHATVLKATGKDTRGNGTASATVTVALSADARGGTAVSVVTDLTVTGRPAQLGRGLLDEVGGRIAAEFAECLATALAAGEAEEVTSSEPSARPRLRAVPDEPVDLLAKAGGPVLKRVLPFAAALLVLLLVLRRRRHR
ncbi:SRPBCC family protein [Saccharothrix algeriensis]|uniref:Carbon monoxide dehydrogenase subunit G n=1 Tax=Saccharothrix algeriensis TaxID=173560 RepID=A0A8T8I506_9PSEU|nr:SRPBCC family protein [Saccharothrix algeriensis]MBM7811727.1 carbon monoxide dehydrogenase subunit G [Saccharothrix algeriensis]QTR05490.1 SRPBCC family protein [Saccharothrix algeriensis]